MAIYPLTLAEYLKPWHNAGLTHLLTDEELLCFAVDQHSDQIQNPVYAAAPIGTTFQQPNPPSQSQAHQNTASQTSVASTDLSTLTPVVTWPRPWQLLFERTHSAPLLWTYQELGDDLCGASSKVRSDCLRKLIIRLQLPKGSNTFWPPNIPKHSADSGLTESSYNITNQNDFFFEGLQRLKPRAVITLGTIPTIAGELDLSHTHPFTQTIYKGMLIITLPGIEQLIVDSQLQRAAIYLRSAIPGTLLSAI